jgi:MFS family permease
MTAVTLLALLSFAGEYTAYNVSLVWIDRLLTKNGQTDAFAFVFIGTISAIYLVLSGVVSVPFGALCDRFGRRTMAIVGCVVGAIGLFGLAGAGEIPGTISYILAISSVLILLGVGHGSYTASALAYTGDISTEKNVGKAYGLVETAEYVSFSFAGLLGAALVVVIGFQLTFVISAFLILAGGVVAAVGMPDLRPTTSMVTTPVGSGSLITDSSGKNSASKNSGSSTSSDLVAEKPPMKGIWKTFVQAIRTPSVLISLFSMLLISLGIQVFRNFVPLYSASGNVSSPFLLALSSVVAGAGLIASIPIGAFLDKSRKYMMMLVAGLLLAAVSFWIIFLYPDVLDLLVWSVFFGIAVSMTRVPQAVIIAEDTITENRATTMGADHAFEHAGYGIGALSGGLLISAFGFVGAFQTYAAVMLIGGLVIFVLYRWKKFR